MLYDRKYDSKVKLFAICRSSQNDVSVVKYDCRVFMIDQWTYGVILIDKLKLWVDYIFFGISNTYNQNGFKAFLFCLLSN